MSKKILDPDAVRCAVLEGDADQSRVLAEKSLQAGLEPLKALEPFIAAIRYAGDLFEQGEFFLPQLLLAASAMKAALEVIFPETGGTATERPMAQGIVLAGTVQGDIHEIGKNLVCALLSANGFKVVDLGADVSWEKLQDGISRHQPDILVLSALLTTTMIQQKQVIEKLVEAGWRDRLKVMVGGAPVTADWATSIGADGYAPDAARAVDKALLLLGKSRA